MEEQIPLRRVIAAAAHGAWTAFLVGVLLTAFSFIVRDVLISYSPEFIASVIGVRVGVIGAIWFAFLGLWKLLTGVFLLVAIALSSWWRAL